MNIGILGGGQLALMLSKAAQHLGHKVFIYSSESNKTLDTLAHVTHGKYNDAEKIQHFSEQLDVLTYEFEHLDVEALAKLKNLHILKPSLDALKITQDRNLEKNLLSKLGIALPKYSLITDLGSLHRSAQWVGFPCVIKTTRQGYDGKGQMLVQNIEEALHAFKTLSPHPLIAEEWIKFERELSIIGVRDTNREILYYPIVENLHRNGILFRTKSPAPHMDKKLELQAQQWIRKIFEELDYFGVLTLELFQSDQKLLANEIAPRVHNSGHWTIEGAQTSQFENHIRAICGMELGGVAIKKFSLMYNCVGELPPQDFFTNHPEFVLHDYNKSVRPARKLAHMTACFEQESDLIDCITRVEPDIRFRV
jgi:5-(carboxyamino)imidazole ribonucleotide synthase